MGNAVVDSSGIFGIVKSGPRGVVERGDDCDGGGGGVDDATSSSPSGINPVDSPSTVVRVTFDGSSIKDAMPLVDGLDSTHSAKRRPWTMLGVDASSPVSGISSSQSVSLSSIAFL